MPIRQLLPSSIRRSVGGVCKEQPRTTKREDVRGGPRCNRLMVLMRGGVMIRGGLRRRDAMCTAGTGEHLSGLGRPRRAARGASQVPDIGNEVGNTPKVQGMPARGPVEGRLRALRVRREVARWLGSA